MANYNRPSPTSRSVRYPSRQPAGRQPVRHAGRSAGGIHASQTEFNIFLALVTAIAGVIAFIFGGLLIRGNQLMAKVLSVGLQFGLLTFVVLIAVSILSLIQGTSSRSASFLESPVGKIALTVACTLIIALLAGLFQWLYGLNKDRKVVPSTSYVFVIDDSGSMSTSDPNQKRYSAIQAVMQNMPGDFPYMVYGFSDNIEILRDMMPASQGTPAIYSQSNGGTSIKGALSRVISDYQSGVWSGGAAPRVILLTDGYPTDMAFSREINSVLQQYVASGIIICTVGLDKVDESLMRQIAQTTGGVFINVDNASDLSSSMAQAAISHSSRDLLSYRYPETNGWLRGIMRVFFLFVLGALVGLASALVYGAPDSLAFSALTSAGQALVGAILFELFTAPLHASDRLMQLILWILIATLLGIKVNIYRNRNRSEKMII